MTNRVRFPLRRVDGSFSFEAQFSLDSAPEDIGPSVQKWLDQWVVKHGANESKSSGVDATARRVFLDDFISTPKVTGVANDYLYIRFDCTAQADHWKNWFVMITRALLNRFTQIGELLKCESIDGDDERINGRKA